MYMLCCSRQDKDHTANTLGVKILLSLHKRVEQLPVSAVHHCLCLQAFKFTPYRDSALTFLICSTILQGKQDTFRENCHARLQERSEACKIQTHKHTLLLWTLCGTTTEPKAERKDYFPTRNHDVKLVSGSSASKHTCRSARDSQLVTQPLCTALPSATASCSKDSTRSRLSIQSTA